MIDMTLLNETEQIKMTLKDNVTGGTSDYNDLTNKPQINGKTLQGNLTLEELGIIVNAVKDILINGKTIVDENGNANIPIANENTKFGLTRYHSQFGVYAGSDGYARVITASETSIKDRGLHPFSIAPSNYDYAVKCAMTDGKGTEWTSQEKASARARIGVDLAPMLDAPLVIEEDLVGAMNIELPTPCEQVLMLVKQPLNTTSIALYSGVIFEDQYSTGAGSLMGYAATKPNGFVSYKLTVLNSGIVESVTVNASGVVNQIYSQFANQVGKKIAKVGLSSISATLPKGTEIMVLGK